MTLAVIDQIADAAVTELGNASLGRSISPVAVDMPELDQKTTGVLVQVLTHQYAMHLESRAAPNGEHHLYVLVSKKLEHLDKASREDGSSRAELRAMKLLVEEIAKLFLGHRLTAYTDALCLEAVVNPLYDEDDLTNKGRFTSAILLTFHV